MTKKDYLFGIGAGFLIGLLAMPVLQTAKPSLYHAFAWSILPFFLVATFIGLLISHWIGRRFTFIWQVAKFGVIGVLNTLVDLGVLAALILFFRNSHAIESGMTAIAIGALAVTYYTIYKSISFIVAVINSYYWNKYWTFETSVAAKTRAAFTQFFLVSIIGFFINVSISTYVFKSVAPIGGVTAGQWGLVGAATGSVLGLAWNFVGYKFVVFKDQT